MSSRLTLLVLAAAAAGCGAHQVHTRTAQDLGPTETALVHVASGLALKAIDGDPEVGGRSTTQRPLSVRLEPGRHTLTIYFREDSGSDQVLMKTYTTTRSDPVDVELFARAGRVYSISFDTYGTAWSPRIREIEPE